MVYFLRRHSYWLELVARWTERLKRTARDWMLVVTARLVTGRSRAKPIAEGHRRYYRRALRMPVW